MPSPKFLSGKVLSKLHPFFAFFALSILIIFFLSACLPVSTTTDPLTWSSADLRILSADFSFDPSQDIVAVYTRKLGSDLQIRIDYLNLLSQNLSDIYIALDTEPGGTTYLPINSKTQLNWDTLLILPADEAPQAYKSASQDGANDSILLRTDVIPRIQRDHLNDTTTISLNISPFPENQHLFQAQILLTSAGRLDPIEIIGPFRFDDNPHNRAPVLIAFWNVFPAYTPAQALRRWDGAHTGPLGERHGLNLLLQAVNNHEIPVVLLDLKSPNSLSALDYIGELELIKSLARKGLLVLPDSLPRTNTIYEKDQSAGMLQESDEALIQILPDWVLECALSEIRQVSQSFSFPNSNLLYAPQLPARPPSGYTTILTFSYDPKPARWMGSNLIPLPFNSQAPQATDEGLSLDMRKVLLKLALGFENDPTNFVILGGNLPESTWGDPESVEATMRYIAEHPWINPIDKNDILAMRIFPRESSLVSNIIPELARIRTDPAIDCDQIIQVGASFDVNPVLLSAWQAYVSLISPLPPEPNTLELLRENYSPQIDDLLLAADWVKHGYTIADCEVDPDLDGQSVCILASENYFALFEREGARLVYFFVRSPNEQDAGNYVHQIIGPTSQFLVGMGDPGSWNLNAGRLAETGGVHGGFSDNHHERDFYIPTVYSPAQIVFKSTDGTLTKSFTINTQGLLVEYESNTPVSTVIPLALDPWTRFSTSWGLRYLETWSDRGWEWSLQGGPQIEIIADGEIFPHPFIASRPMLNAREDPNFGYPPGHFVPFPIAIVDIHSKSDSLTIQLLISQ